MLHDPKVLECPPRVAQLYDPRAQHARHVVIVVTGDELNGVGQPAHVNVGRDFQPVGQRQSQLGPWHDCRGAQGATDCHGAQGIPDLARPFWL